MELVPNHLAGCAYSAGVNMLSVTQTPAQYVQSVIQVTNTNKVQQLHKDKKKVK
jgi:hypothetical protein